MKKKRVSVPAVTRAFGGRVNLHRRQKLLTQTELAEQVSEQFGVDLSAATISLIETGQREPTLGEVLILCAYFDLSLNIMLAPMEDIKIGKKTFNHEFDRVLNTMMIESSMDSALEELKELQKKTREALQKFERVRR